MPLIADASRRRTYLSENFDNDFGHDFQTSLKNHVKTLTSQMKAVLPKPVLEKVSKTQDLGHDNRFSTRRDTI